MNDLLFDMWWVLLFSGHEDMARRIGRLMLMPESNKFFDNEIHGQVRVGLRRWAFQ